jgi:hypothetical protein
MLPVKVLITRLAKYSVLVLVLLLLGSPVLYVANQYRLKKKYERALSQIRIGDSKQRVVSLMGEPEETRWCYPLPNSDDTPEQKRFHEQCVDQYWYFTFLKPYYVSFDGNNQVSGKDYTISP